MRRHDAAIAALALAASIPWGPARAAVASAPCTAVPLYEAGRVVGNVCAEAPGDDHVVLDLSDDWTPLVFSETADLAQPYRATFLTLANERVGPEARWRTARRDRYFELFGIFPSLGVVRRRLLDVPRHACHAAVDDGALARIGRTIAPWDENSNADPGRADALGVVQAHLACEGFLPRAARPGVFDGATQDALALYQRRHMIPSAAVVDRETREALLTSSAELDFRTLLRVLRERVVDASALLEDGSAGAAWEPILGRFVDSPEYRPRLRPQPLPGAAPDLVDRATEAAAVALGWTSPDAAAAAMSAGVAARVAVHAPPPPPYAGRIVDVRVEIDRGDVWTSYPLDAEGERLPSPVKNRPTLTIFAITDGGEVPLVRWPTTIGAWKDEKLPDESVDLRYKPSPVGRAYWRDLVAAPAWFPPPTTPDRELVQPRGGGAWRADDDAVGPGYRSAYGLLALIHVRASAAATGENAFSDLAIRTHGSGNYRSILRGSSHGCHRLFNHLALRLGSYLLAHHGFERRGVIREAYARTIHWKGRTLKLRVDDRGYRYVLEPPVTVDVLPGRIVRSRAPAARRPMDLIVTPPG
ncbi:MAG TPA: peptidoglycan-binding domain-containing protein [Polyangia bacterium]|nr:peptidoglycan-binding domain-containing protein [Polyangia bacterium]